MKHLLLLATLCLPLAAVRAQSGSNEFLRFVGDQARAMRRADRPPANTAEWAQQRLALRLRLARAWRTFPPRTAPPQARAFGELQRDGYRVEKLAIETFPGVWMTANAYVPDARAGKLPALLMVHGHWRGAKQDPVVQARCLGAVKLGFFVLAVDAFGAGERGIGRALGEYHGDMTAATLLPAGLPLSGIQVFENMRAADYLQSRPEVDPARIGITGASGGGNQTMYAGAWDGRFGAVAPVCSVGNYQAYLGAACCLCEVIPGALRFTEEWGVLGLAAPRALMVVSASRDSRQFSPREAAISIAQAKSVFSLLGRPTDLRHTVFESGHDYSREMREAVYGWMTLHLKQEGDGSSIAEPEFVAEPPELLRCFPGDSRPDDWVTLPRFAAAEGRRLLDLRAAARAKVGSVREWNTEKARLRNVLAEDLLGIAVKRPPFASSARIDGETRVITFSPEPGLTLTATQQFWRRDRLLVMANLEGAAAAASQPLVKQAAAADWSVIVLDLRATGLLAWPSDTVGRAPDHTSAEWALWIGRPLLGHWAWDLRRLLDTLRERDGRLPTRVAIAGSGPAAILALTAAALDERFAGVLATGPLASFVSDTPYEKQRLGIVVPGILKEFGDVADLAALVAPRPLLIQGALRGDGEPLADEDLQRHFQFTKRIYKLLDAPRWTLTPQNGPDATAQFLHELAGKTADR